ncbi:hypothetical protein FraEuI1c_1753 [Pseudofrankia inefficax]|uniref:Uncharacterized protein n=2 Tax=Pseudofrankia inefficax (strain DSM 45817 / CECT 9037 / DDB 130130 / EuI1c) TaxID=298654 RepID=E3JBD7_PSEI1|nr:hypothetical protein FraEuI1c_1753 [Pseudofrankia inefficax]
MFRSMLSTLEELTLLILPHGGQRTARRNAWRAATDLHVTSGYRWADGGTGSVGALAPVTPRGAGAARAIVPAIPTPAPARAAIAHR